MLNAHWTWGRGGAPQWVWFLFGFASLLLNVVFLYALRRLMRDRGERSSDAEPAEMLQKMRQVQSRFLSHISHEFKTPLAGIMGYADQLLIDADLRWQQREQLLALKRCALQVTGLVDDLLDLSSLDTGRSEVHLKEFNFVQLLRDVMSMIELRLMDKVVNFRVVFAEPLPEFLITDSVRLRQILVHLLGNAVKFTEQGEVMLTLSAIRLTEQGRLILKFEVSDSGCGIAEELRDRIFQRFSQTHQTFNRQSKGPGLGLYLSKRLAQQLGGDLHLVHSSPDKGSTFQGEITAQIPPESRFVAEFVPAQSFHDTLEDLKAFEGKLKDLSVLLVEDGLDNQRIFTYFLKLAGAQVHIEKDGVQALEKINSGFPIDIVLMDIQLPVMDGVAVTRHLRANGFTKPIIAVSAHALHDDKQRAVEQGFSDFLAKPVEIEKLIGLLMFHTGRLGTIKAGASVAVGDGSQPNQEVAVENGSDDGVILSRYHHKTIYRQMISEFVSGLDERWSEGQKLLAHQRWEEFSRSMHQLRGAAATYGYPSLSHLAGEMEMAARSVGDDAESFLHLEKKAHSMKELCEKIRAGMPGQ